MMPFLSTLAAHPIIPLFLFLNLAIGFWAHTKAKANSFEDYALASRSLPTGVLVMTLLGTFLSNQEFARMGRIFEAGIIVAIFSFFRFCIPALFTSAFIAPQLIFFESTTLGGVMRKLYGRWAQLLTGSIHLAFSLAMLATQIAVIGLISKQLLQTNFAMPVLFFGGIMVIYSTLGGMRAVSYTDVFQLIMALLVFFWVTQKAMLAAGGIGQVFQRVSSQYPDKLKVLSYSMIFDRLREQLYVNLLSFAFTLSPPIVHRMLMVKDKRKVSKMWYTCIIIYGITATMVALIAFFATVNQERFGLEKGHNIFVKVIQALFTENSWPLDIILVGIIGILLSTMDSFLHTIGIIWIEDILRPVRSLLGYRKLGENRQIKYARVAIFLTGIFAVLIGTQVEDIGPRFIGRKLLVPLFSLQAVVTIPFILGVMGLKTDRASFFSFCVTYLSVFAFQKWIIAWSTKPMHQTYGQYFLIALPLGVLAYFIAHIVHNKGIVTAVRERDYIAEQLWIPTWQGAVGYVKSWLLAPLHLPTLASRKIVNNPTHSLSFSILIFALYTFSSVMTGGGNDLGIANFMAGVHVVGITLCAGLMLEGIWPTRIKPYFALYWFFTLFYCLAFGSTLAFLRAHGDTMAVGKWFFNFMLLAALVDSMSFITLSCLGSGLAMASWYIVFGSLPVDLLGSIGLLGGYLLFGLLVIVVLFKSSREQHTSQRFDWNRTASSALGHDLRLAVGMLGGTGRALSNAFKVSESMTNAKGEKGYWLPEGQATFLENFSEKMIERGEMAGKEIQDFSDFIKSQVVGTFEQKKSDMRTAAEEAIHKLEDKMPPRVKMTILGKKDFSPKVLSGVFKNVFYNLLWNAATHGKASEVEIRIDGVKRTVSVWDNGGGIPSDILPRIFDLNFSTGRKRSKNSGVGLAFVKMVIAASSGKISCHSRHGDKESFTEFVMEFPEV